MRMDCYKASSAISAVRSLLSFISHHVVSSMCASPILMPLAINPNQSQADANIMLLNLQNYELNKPLSFIWYAASGILLQHQKIG